MSASFPNSIEPVRLSIELGKDADIVIWNAHPFSVYARPEMTMIDGEVYFDRSKDLQKRAEIQKERETLEKMDINRAPASGAATTLPVVPREKREAHRDDVDGGNK